MSRMQKGESMKNRAIEIDGEWFARYNGRVVQGASWAMEGPAATCVSLLESGYYVLNAAGRTIINPAHDPIIRALIGSK